MIIICATIALLCDKLIEPAYLFCIILGLMEIMLWLTLNSKESNK